MSGWVKHLLWSAVVHIVLLLDSYVSYVMCSPAVLYELLYTRVLGVEEEELQVALEGFRGGGRRYRNSHSMCSEDAGYDAPEDRTLRSLTFCLVPLIYSDQWMENASCVYGVSFLERNGNRVVRTALRPKLELRTRRWLEAELMWFGLSCLQCMIDRSVCLRLQRGRANWLCRTRCWKLWNPSCTGTSSSMCGKTVAKVCKLPVSLKVFMIIPK